MADLNVKTKFNSVAQGKPRVFFSCYPGDFDKYFNTICEDIFAYQDCAVFYDEEPESEFDQDLQDRLADMQLFVVLITGNYLKNEYCRAHAREYAFAMEHNIPILPISVEPSLSKLFSEKMEKLGKGYGAVQFLDKTQVDGGEIPYEEKIQARLESVLVGTKLADRIRAAFDAYIFLSYRKKDREYARRLMELIHNIPGCRDIAIWYDEFLVPGEEWNQAIAEAMVKSKLVTLAVTPSVLERPNYVADFEYGQAVAMEKPVLPTELVETDIDALKATFPGLADIVDGKDVDKLAEALKEIAITSNDEDPEHNYLIGLAYINGIDVEKNVERGVNLIKMAAEANLSDAVRTLSQMYFEGSNVHINYEEAVKWQRKLVVLYSKKYGPTSSITLSAKNNLSNRLVEIGKLDEALALVKESYEIRKEKKGEEDPKTLISMNNLSNRLAEAGEYAQALEIMQRVYDIRKRVLGPEHPDTLSSMHNLSNRYYSVGKYEEALKLAQETYEIRKRVLGDEHPETMGSLHNVSIRLNSVGRYEEALQIAEQVYEMRKRILGERNPKTLSSLSNLGTRYSKVGRTVEAMETALKVYQLRLEEFGPENPDTILSMSTLAMRYEDTKQYQEAYEYALKTYEIRLRMYGPENPDTLSSKNTLAGAMEKIGMKDEALKLTKEVLEDRIRLFGPEHPSTLKSRGTLANRYVTLGMEDEAREILLELYETRRRLFGEENPDTLRSKSNLVTRYIHIGDTETALKYAEEVYEARKRIFGESNPDTIKSKKKLESARKAHLSAQETAKHDEEKAAQLLLEMQFNDILMKATGLRVQAETAYETYKTLTAKKHFIMLPSHKKEIAEKKAEIEDLLNDAISLYEQLPAEMTSAVSGKEAARRLLGALK
ncbi:MAG: tetratricopeptide repeat protein [Lachnospiraceae bacterium]|nr:tetratricopeptide repeat protein [Lachnospiraceae bacterium]